MPINFARRNPNPGFDKKLAVYALAGGAMLGLPDAALAGVISDPPGSITLSVPNGGGTASHQLDLNDDGQVDIVFHISSTAGESLGSFHNSVTAYASYGGIRVESKQSHFAHPYESVPTGSLGLPLKYAATLISSYYNGSTLFGPEGLWPNDLAEFRFLGLSFLHNGVPTDGWVRIATELGSANAMIDSWGFDDPAAIPEPASMALFAAGAAGIAAWRRRKAH